MLNKLTNRLTSGAVRVGPLRLQWAFRRKTTAVDISKFESPYRLHLGPGPNWTKPDNHWIDVDIDPNRGDIVVDFSEFVAFPIESGTVQDIYGSHVFEHMSIFVTPTVFKECCRVLSPGGTLRIVLPDVEKSIREYISGNMDFEIFRRRRTRALKKQGLQEYTLFDCLREDFLSKSGQAVLGIDALAHQNAWDFESIRNDLMAAGFSDVKRVAFQESRSSDFSFEGSYDSEANEAYRSMYVEAEK